MIRCYSQRNAKPIMDNIANIEYNNRIPESCENIFSEPEFTILNDSVIGAFHNTVCEYSAKAEIFEFSF